ncbi:hypothetical protein DY000_02034794 [Brassica cretica]|uniref:Uncharacterized protein n=1 Tax=Brassica cretica TaxID=69181 RepID=A0ABQ7DV66_BRACR|nr:hypothetical protein DY000_02034794 [Brassica cretica]
MCKRVASEIRLIYKDTDVSCQSRRTLPPLPPLLSAVSLSLFPFFPSRRLSLAGSHSVHSLLVDPLLSSSPRRISFSQPVSRLISLLAGSLSSPDLSLTGSLSSPDLLLSTCLSPDLSPHGRPHQPSYSLDFRHHYLELAALSLLKGYKFRFMFKFNYQFRCQEMIISTGSKKSSGSRKSSSRHTNTGSSSNSQMAESSAVPNSQTQDSPQAPAPAPAPAPPAPAAPTPAPAAPAPAPAAPAPDPAADLVSINMILASPGHDRLPHLHPDRPPNTLWQVF